MLLCVSQCDKCIKMRLKVEVFLTFVLLLEGCCVTSASAIPWHPLHFSFCVSVTCCHFPCGSLLVSEWKQVYQGQSRATPAAPPHCNQALCKYPALPLPSRHTAASCFSQSYASSLSRKLLFCLARYPWLVSWPLSFLTGSWLQPLAPHLVSLHRSPALPPPCSAAQASSPANSQTCSTVITITLFNKLSLHLQRVCY